jgi:pimeloyl-ACP methyl ester carboxylesterase
MKTLICLAVLLVLFIVLTVIISMIIEALRRPPAIPQSLYWDPGIPVQYTTIDGTRVRYIRAGQGPNLVLLHTIRTQLDLFQKVIPRLAREFTVYALDYPGHGYSDIPQVEYRPELFVDTIEKFLEQQGIRDAILAGVSIGGVIPLLLAAKKHPAVKKIISINPYDYAAGGGITRANIVAWIIFTLARIPVVGETVMRFRNFMVERIIFEGGVASPKAWPEELLAQLYAMGLRKGHYRAFINLIRNARHWEAAHQAYGQVSVPVLIVYGDRDWSRPDERERTVNAVPGARVETVAGGGHFLPVDQPDRVIELIRGFALS